MKKKIIWLALWLVPFLIITVQSLMGVVASNKCVHGPNLSRMELASYTQDSGDDWNRYSSTVKTTCCVNDSYVYIDLSQL